MSTPKEKLLKIKGAGKSGKFFECWKKVY